MSFKKVVSQHFQFVFLCVLSVMSFAEEPKNTSLYVDTIALPVMLISEPGIGFYGLGLGADWHLKEKVSIGTSLNQWGYIDALSVSRLAIRSHYYFSGFQESGFYTTASLAHWKATEKTYDCQQSLSEIRIAGIAGYQVRRGDSFFIRLGLGATSGKIFVEPCSEEELGTPAIAEMAIGFSF